MDQIDQFKQELVRALDWQDAHANFDAAVQDVPVELRGVQLEGLPYSLWQLLEHTRICQYDILEFSRDPNYRELKFEEYWPPTVAPPSEDAWEKSIASFHADLESLKQLFMDKSIDLVANIPHGTGQTYLRELILVIDHNAYHLGQMVIIRRLLSNWSS